MSGLSFLAPAGLAALIGIPLIVLFHMRHFTPVERHVPTLRFWLAASPVRTDDSRFRLPPLTLLLLLQLLVAGLLGLALARPAVSDALGSIAQRTEPVHLVVLLDGSTSMSAIDTESGVSRYEAARSVAVSRLSSLREGDTATVLVLGSQINTLQSSDHAGIDALAGRLRNWELPGGIADLNAALRLVANLDLPGVREQILVLSDGAVSADPALVEALDAAITFERFGNPGSANLAITDIEARPNLENTARSDLYVQIANFSDQRRATTVLVAADGIEAYRQDVDVDANSELDLVVNTLPEDASRVIVEVRSSDSFFADNQASLWLRQESRFALRILLVSDVLGHVQRALVSLPGASVDTISSSESLRGELPAGPYDLIVYDGTAPTLGDVPHAPLVLINSPRDGLITTLGMITIPTVERIRANDPLLKGVDLTGLTFRETPVHQLDASAVEVVGAAEGSLIYRATAPSSGQPMVVLAFDVEQSNLAQRIAFPILMANIVNELSPNPLPSSVTLGEPVTYTPHASARTVRVTNPAGTIVELPVEQQTAASAADRDGSAAFRDVSYAATGMPGTYVLEELNGSGRTIASASLVVNAGHPRESDLRADPALPDVLAMASEGNGGRAQATLSDLWPVLVAVALGLLLCEWLWSTLAGSRNRARSIARPVEAVRS